MAKEIKKTEEKPRFSFVFTKTNYIIMGIGLVLLALGYILLAGGGSDDPNVFNYEMFNNRRLYVAPILIILGLIAEVVAIMYKPKEQ
ncbi:MAG: DUF3098 domain-containing protein [Bacteroidales bacterium]|nr:DUF3098 domain-containing protein [Bacteroidales bacterium]MBP5645068.1 DUF3098 domain-containing protein [Bacteroidales bacterium]